MLAAMEQDADDGHYPTPPDSEEESYWNGGRSSHKELELEQWRLRRKHGRSMLPVRRALTVTARPLNTPRRMLKARPQAQA